MIVGTWACPRPWLLVRGDGRGQAPHENLSPKASRFPYKVGHALAHDVGAGSPQGTIPTVPVFSQDRGTTAFR
jgi:hypothetical protein